VRLDHVERVAGIERCTRDPRLQLVDLLREIFGVTGVRVERERSALIRSRRAAQAEIDAPGRDRFEHAELLGHLER
jgi:hypothetical protein